MSVQISVRCGEWLIIRVDGQQQWMEGKPTFAGIKTATGATYLDTVLLEKDRYGRPMLVMMVDLTGMIDGKPVNQQATTIYHESLHRRGLSTPHSIYGDVVIVNDQDFV